jgi:hypothetical protein
VNGYFVCLALGMGKTESDISAQPFGPPIDGSISPEFGKIVEAHFCPNGHLSPHRVRKTRRLVPLAQTNALRARVQPDNLPRAAIGGLR